MGFIKKGDIILKNRLYTNPYSWYGHVGLKINDTTIAEYPNYSEGYREMEQARWLSEDRMYLVLRYKKMDRNFLNSLLANVEYAKFKPYSIFVFKHESDKFYCSYYVWYLYANTARSMGYDLDIDGDGGFFVFPYDFLKSSELLVVEF